LPAPSANRRTQQRRSGTRTRGSREYVACSARNNRPEESGAPCQLIERLATLPGVRAVAQVSKVPLSPGRTQGTFRLPAQERTHEFDVNAVSPEYFAVLGLPIVSGRTFTRAELDGEARAAMVTEATARRFWPGRDPVGRTIVAATSPETVLEIVGIVRDAHVSHVANTESAYLYLPAGPSVQRRLALLVRGKTDPEPLARSIPLDNREARRRPARAGTAPGGQIWISGEGCPGRSRPSLDP
jgi:hypothetical protein